MVSWKVSLALSEDSVTRSSIKCRRACSVTSVEPAASPNVGVTGHSQICVVGTSAGRGVTGGSPTCAFR